MSCKKISLIIPTINRITEVDKLLKAISKIDYKMLAEVIIVDQNTENILDSVIEEYSQLYKIIHCKVKFKGAAKARNYGSQFATGEILGFPDDDSEILPVTLNIVNEIFEQYNNITAVFGTVADKTNNINIIHYLKRKTYVNYFNLYNTCIECGFFIKKEEFVKIGMFDENLGIGTYYGSEEGADLFCRLLYQKKKMLYVPEKFYYHPNKKREDNMSKYYSYGLGTGRLAVKHLKKYKKIIPYIYLILKNIKSNIIILYGKIKKDDYIVKRNQSLKKGRKEAVKDKY